MSVAPAQAQNGANFFDRKTINILVGVSAGGEYDLLARLTARHIGNHIPGKPKIIVQNMTGAGGIVMANYLYNIAKKDGTYLGAISNGFQVVQALYPKKIKFDTGKFHFIGAIAPTVETMVLWHTAGAKSVAEATQKSIPIGAVSKSSITFAYPMLLNELAGTQFKITTGYRGGNGINLAMEKGEVAGRDNTWSSWKATRSGWLKDKKIIVISYAGPKPKDLPDVPNLLSYAKTEADKQLVNLIVSGTELGRPLVAPPGVPAERIKALRAAYAATMKDAAFLADA
ncbi:MAG: tripartite tricarboxylate transporter substrate-binding protein, partial [Beijerinckiaceae bacterium]|nr:tripartite tricarboxylate transporter substrate-binding protein [Beijerinckiaceae bacterium]